MLLLEVILTVWLCVSYHRSGRIWALGLIPIGIMLGVSICLGVVIGAGAALSGANAVGDMSGFWFLDATALLAMIVLLVRNSRQ